ncbi:hypothetical protein MOMA_07696 [Moraxella macacae 0408225]|uniref:Uncharacterized protein n=1 Tax=Moraxella macacae 0408225 TaxID=1230338 RepID=L2F5W9_9GAMM|nr:hypothetical protein [Moraxella macacae]ELA08427.1 hypothetical protein MOMA_07696 [Moraxella macacae 0408225]
MKILIQINANNTLLCHEALSMAFALASFEHHIQLYLGDYLCDCLQNEPGGKFAKMLASLALYDMPNLWVNQQNFNKLNTLDLDSQIIENFDKTAFDGIFSL